MFFSTLLRQATTVLRYAATSKRLPLRFRRTMQMFVSFLMPTGCRRGMADERTTHAKAHRHDHYHTKHCHAAFASGMTRPPSFEFHSSSRRKGYEQPGATHINAEDAPADGPSTTTSRTLIGYTRCGRAR